jgi:hypothetical protein
VADADWLAHRKYLLGDDLEVRDHGEAVSAAITWIWGLIKIGPVTYRTDDPVTRAVAQAEMWAAAAVFDGGGTTERELRGTCASLGVHYCPPDFDRLSLEHGRGFYETLSWLTGSLDGWRQGRKPPVELPVRATDGTVAAAARSRELIGLIEDTRRRAQETLRRR